MKAKRYTVILNDNNNTVVYTDSLERVNSRGKKVQKFPDAARIIDNSEVGDPKDQTDREEPLNEMVVIDTTPCIFFQEFLREMFEIENLLAASLGREFRFSNPVQY
mgnify:CR=1 FL=1